MHRIETNLFLVSDPAMFGHQAVFMIDADRIAVSFDDHFSVGLAYRHRVIIAIKAHQGKLGSPCSC
ncbi:hypothetical protein OAG20_01170, partial [Verrucomicrobiales bacterium]|nr:hypothetical protein [Verrucomicrobiales bacterium]